MQGSVARTSRRGLGLVFAAVLLLSTVGATTVTFDRTARAAAPTVCTGIPNCHRVARVDVDDNGRLDGVGVVNRVRNGSGTATVHVRLAGGHRTARTVKLEFWHSKPWWGAGRIDGVPGAELVLGRTAGAHTLFFHVLTLRSGKLRAVRAPGGGQWTVDGSYSSNVGVWRTWKNGRAYVTIRTAQRNSDGTGHHGSDTKYRWASGWQKVSSVRRHYARDRAAFAVSGWHVRGLPRNA